MTTKILIEADLGKKGVERCDVAVYVNDKLIATHFDKSYSDLKSIASEMEAQYPDAELEVWCSGDDCCGKTHHWQITIQPE